MRWGGDPKSGIDVGETSTGSAPLGNENRSFISHLGDNCLASRNFNREIFDFDCFESLLGEKGFFACFIRGIELPGFLGGLVTVSRHAVGSY